MTVFGLNKLEENAYSKGLLLRLQVSRPFNLWAIRLVVAEEVQPEKIQIWGEMKFWAYGGEKGLQLDTMRVNSRAPTGVGHLVWAATMAWALERTPCKRARLLAIYDEGDQHSRLVNYFQRRGFSVVKEVGSSVTDLPLRMIWGGAGSLMIADCKSVFVKSFALWESSQAINKVG